MTNSLHELETQILGTLLITPDAIKKIVTLLPRSEAFQSPIHQAIYEQMLFSSSQGGETDVITINYYLTNRAVQSILTKHGGKMDTWMQYLRSLTPAGREATGSYLHKCGLLQQEYIRLSYAKQLNELFTAVQDESQDILLLMDKNRTWLDRMTNRLCEQKEKPFSTVLNEVVDRAEQAALSGNPITGIGSLLADFDIFTKGFHPGTMTILAGRPGMGKTAVACQIAHNIAVEQRIAVAFFSLEMTPDQMAGRSLAIDSSIKNSHVTAGIDSLGNAVNIERLRESAKRVGGAPLSIYDKVRSLPQLKARISQFVNKYGKEVLVIIDYLQLVKTGTNLDLNITACVSHVSREIKDTAIEYEIPVLALAQLNREVEDRTGNRPRLSDLNHSGSLEQDADTVVFLLSPGYYSNVDKEGHAIDPRLLYAIIAKNRHGAFHKDDEAISLDYDRSTNQVQNYVSYAAQIDAFEAVNKSVNVTF